MTDPGPQAGGDLWIRCTRPLSTWNDLTLDDMVFAYRKAKVDCFFERALSMARAFADYEQSLEANLKHLLKRLRTPKGRRSLAKDPKLLGQQVLIPKKLDSRPKQKLDSKPKPADGAFFSDMDRALDHLVKGHQLTAEFRVAGEFPVDFHVLSALWVNRVGHRFDACLRERAYGARVRRYGDDGSPSARPYHIKAMGTMPPYFRAYRRWREDGLAAIRRELEAGQRVICLTLDIRNYFHRIDPTFATSDEFLTAIGLGGTQTKGSTPTASPLSKTDRELTELICGSLKAWSKQTKEFIAQHSDEKVSTGGLPIGVTAARVLANVLLQPLDQLLVEHLVPISYGRYVDDIFLVLRDGGNLKDTADVMGHIQKHLPDGVLTDEAASEGCDVYRIDLKAGQEATELVLQDSKVKVFFLEGNAGLDLLDVVRSEIRDLASERRLLPEPAFLTKKTSAQVLAASHDVKERADTLRRADGLSIRRMGWAIQLRWAETLALDLPPNEWRKQRSDFLRFARDHVLRPERLLDHMDYLPRLLGLAVACEDWQAASELVAQTSRALTSLERACSSSGNGVKLNGYPASKLVDEVWRGVRQSLGSLMRDALLRAWPLALVPEGALPSSQSDARARVFEALNREFPDQENGQGGPTAADAWRVVANRIRALAWSDLARRPLKELWRDHRNPETGPAWDEDLGDIAACFGGEEGDLGVIRRFLDQFERRKHLPSSSSPSPTERPSTLRPFLFPTRPLSLQEIAEWDPACVGLASEPGEASVSDPSEHWERLARALRGIWTRRRPQEPPLHEATGNGREPPLVVAVGEAGEMPRPVLCISNFETHEAAWHQAAAGHPVETLGRYKQFARFVNTVLTARPRPHYLLLPELSVPRRWVSSLVNRMLESRISVVAGVEYGHIDTQRVVNEAVLALTDDRLGFPSSVLIRQGKTAPAPGEEEELLRLHGKILQGFEHQPVVYRHKGFDFAVLICSELQDIRKRTSFQGEVDCLMIPAWNRDLETFSALLESAALDVHAYIALVNNRKYGDSRVRAPAKEAFSRDVCRIRGGLDDHVVLVQLDIEDLRRFHSRVKNWARGEDPFKPVPQGFRVASRRQSTPHGTTPTSSQANPSPGGAADTDATPA